MELHIKHFKCHSNYKVIISKGTTLFKGPSGSGKSSIFEAITWVLYGVTRDIDPWTNETAKTKVILKYDGMKIVRSKRPNRLMLTNADGIFEDAVAQDIIEDTFRTKSIWECTGYIDEDAKNTFPYLTPKIRLNTLMTLIYPSGNPEEEIEKIKESISLSRREYESIGAVYESYKKDYDRFWKKNSKDILSIEEQGIPTYTIEELKTEVKNLNKELIELRDLETRQKVNEERLLSINSELDRLDKVLSEEINLEQLEKELDIAIKRESLSRSKYLKQDVIIDTFTEDDYISTLEKEKEYSRYIKILYKYNVDGLGYLSLLEKTKDRIRNSNTDFYPLLKRKEDLAKKIEIERYPADVIYSWDDTLRAKEYEANERYNAPLLRELERYNIFLSISEMESIVSNESNYKLLRRKRELEEQILSLGEALQPQHTFTHEDYYNTQEIEKKRAMIEKYQLTREHFDNLSDIESAYNVYLRYGDNRLSSFDEYDLSNAQLLDDYYRVYGTKDYSILLEYISKAKLYYKFMGHIDLYETYGSKALSSIIVSKQELDRLKNELDEIENKVEVLKCPHCDKDVYFRDEKLVKLNKSYSPQQIDELKRKYQESMLYYEISEKKKNLTSFPNIGKITEYSSYKAYYKGSMYLDEPQYVAHSADKISKQLEFQRLYGNLSDKAKKYYKESSNIYKHLLQIDAYYNTPDFSSEYINKCIEEEKKYSQYLTLKNELDSIDVPDLPDCVEDIAKVKKCLSLHRRIREIGEAPPDTSANMERFIKQQEEYIKYKEAKEEYDSIIVPDMTIISLEELERLKDILQDLESVSNITPPSYSSPYIRDSIEKSKILSSLSSLPEARDRNILEKEKKNQLSIRRNQDAAVIMKDKLTIEKSSIIIDDSLAEKIDVCMESLESYQDEIWVTQLYSEYLSHKNKLDEIDNDRTLKVRNYTKDEELLKEAMDTVHQKLTSLLSNINRCIERILRDIFIDPIEVRLKTFKQLKTKDVLRPEINLEIKYKGGMINSIKKISKGERYRIILAITLALNEVSRLPILLMDETLAHIDQELKELVTNVLKKYAEDKFLVIIAHDVVEGLYGDVKSLN